ncbi:MAG: ribosome biogenesis GTP-binding protein YihA/YsxC [Thermodesulfobacteriota bacterium]
MEPKLTLIQTIYQVEKVQPIPEPQIALAGRSNVGKSTLINCLAGSKKLARTSSTPGKTRSLNMYWVDPYSFYFVDLPGYGYAKCSKAEREKWSILIDKYLETNQPKISCMIIIIDSRHAPQKMDLDLIEFLRAQNISFIPVLTKTDKCKMSWRNKVQTIWKDIVPQGKKPVLFSAKTHKGKDELWSEILAAVGN